MATRFQSRLEPLQSLADLLPAMCENLSLARAQISLEQVRSILQSGELERVLFVSAGDFANSAAPLAAAIVIQPPSGRTEASALDSATVVHAGAFAPLEENERKEIAEIIADQIDRQLRDRGVEFVQWSTDDIAAASSASIATWCSGLGFEPLATLDYLSDKIDEGIPPGNSTHQRSLRFEPMDWNCDDEFNTFAALVEQTYEQTHDCPMLAKYRTSIQAIAGYRSSGAFAPSWWLRLVDPDQGEDLGCLIMGHHRSNDVPPGGDVVEIVYMGLVPTARGQGLGSELVRMAREFGHRAGCERIILAVDRRNHPARSIYDRAGLQSVLSETVWVKSLPPQAASAAGSH